MKRILVASVLTLTSGWLSFTAVNRSLDAVKPPGDPGGPATQGPDGALRSNWRPPPAQIPETGLTPRSNDIVVPETRGEVAVCPTVTSDDVSDAHLSRTKFGSRSAVASFLRTSSGHDAMRRALLPSFASATSVLKSCYRPAPDDRAVVYLGIHIRSNRDSASVVDAAVLRIDAPAESEGPIRDCVAAFKTGQLPISVRARRGETFLEYDDLYLKEVPVPLGPKSIEHMLAARKAAMKQPPLLQSQAR